MLDTCAVADAASTGSHGVKQAIAAYTPDQIMRQVGNQSFTFNLVEALARLGTGRPFSVQRLHEEIIASQHLKFPYSPTANGTGKTSASHERMPVCFSLTPGTLQSITLAPIGAQPPIPSLLASPMDPLGEHEAQAARNNHAELIKVNSSPDLTFEEMRALVCTTFLGEPSHEMASFKQWLHNTPVAASRIAVEGMFHGPPTVLLISMPIAIWNVLAADRTCGFLGYVNSHNMTTEYQRLVGGISPLSKAATFKELEDGKILLEARQAAASTPVMLRHEPMHPDALQQDAMRAENLDPLGLGPNTIPQSIYPEPPAANIPGHKDEVEDSVEMHEAAEQLKALSHVRHVSHDHANSERNHSHIPSEDSPGMRSTRDESASSPENGDSGAEDPMYTQEYNAPSRPKHPRRSMPKAGPKQDTRCSLCSHAPFKDSSSLRKHIAAAHTRPFPCAFSFAGCTSTFGSKNEWKRHIASQHLCLTYYRCSSCPQSTVEGKGNEFNRKDLFTQHLRRMHAPFAIKKALTKGDSKLQLEWETHVKDMQASCLVIRRQPPQRSACPKPDCSNVFEGAGSWDDWTEHVGRHMEKGEAGRLGVDRLLAKWALDQGIIERKEDGEYRLIGTEREAGAGAGYYSDGNGGVVARHFDDGKGEAENMLLDA